MSENAIAELLQGALSGAERAEAEAHLDACGRCTQLLATLVKAYGDVPTEPRAGGRGGNEPLARGSVVDRYVLLNVIGIGGMGVVYAAYDPELERTVALKLLRPAASTQGVTRQAAARLVHEAKAMAKLSSPHVVVVHDVSAVGGRLCLAMELVRGVTLRRWLEAEPRPVRAIIDVFEQAGRGLAAAHEAGVVHRDFKPDNVLVTDAGLAKVTDFGLAWDAGEGAPFAGGTPGYMAPEQLRGEPLDGRSDQFSFCVALYEALYGERPPLEGAPERPARPPSAPASRPSCGAPRGLRPIVLRGLCPEPGGRYPSMNALLGALRRSARPPTRALLGLGGAFLLGLGAVLGYGQRGAKATPACEGGRDAWAAAWGEGQRSAARAAFAATGLPYADRAWQTSERALDAFGDAWVAQHREACEATQVRHEQSSELLDLRMQCLSLQMRQAAELGALLGAADERLVENAAQAAQSLPSPSLCARVDELRAPLRPPADAALRAKVAEVREGLARVRAQQDAGRYVEGRAAARELAQAADETRYEPLRAEAHLQAAELATRLGQNVPAEASARLAEIAAVAGRHDEAAATSWTLLVMLAARSRRAEEGAHYAALAKAAVARLGGSPPLEARLLDYEGLSLEVAGRHAESVELRRRACELAGRAYGAEHSFTATRCGNLATALDAAGRRREAVEQFRATNAAAERLLGAEHPEVIFGLQSLGRTLFQMGRYEEAAEAAERALRAQEKNFGPRNRSIASILMDLGNAVRALDRVDDAIGLFQRGLAIYQATELGPKEPAPAVCLDNLCSALAAAGRYAEALEACERADALLAADAAERANLYLHWGDLAEAQGRTDEALTRYGRALAIDERTIGLDHPDAAATLSAVGRTHLALGRRATGRAGLERALALLAPTDDEPGDPILLGDTRYALARAMRDGAESRALAEQARLDYQRAGRQGASRLQTLERLLGGAVGGRAKLERCRVSPQTAPTRHSQTRAPRTLTTPSPTLRRAGRGASGEAAHRDNNLSTVAMFPRRVATNRGNAAVIASSSAPLRAEPSVDDGRAPNRPYPRRVESHARPRSLLPSRLASSRS